MSPFEAMTDLLQGRDMNDGLKSSTMMILY